MQNDLHVGTLIPTFPVRQDSGWHLVTSPSGDRDSLASSAHSCRLGLSEESPSVCLVRAVGSGADHDRVVHASECQNRIDTFTPSDLCVGADR
jgi:hypothetical protein